MIIARAHAGAMPGPAGNPLAVAHGSVPIGDSNAPPVRQSHRSPSRVKSAPDDAKKSEALLIWIGMGIGIAIGIAIGFYSAGNFRYR
jgi:hypothetical protein